jgi:hypothetical protein
VSVSACCCDIVSAGGKSSDRIPVKPCGIVE